jgi:uncharacterized protein (DUF58 family)
MPAATIQLLPPALMARLDGLDILSRKILSGKVRGEHVAHGRGSSLEFEGVRDYAPGDDPRFIDWNILARLDRLLLKLFAPEEDLQVHLLLDQSKSCEWGEPNKAFFLKQLAAAIGYVGVVNQHRVRAWVMADRITAIGPNQRGRAAIRPMIASLEALNVGEACNFERCVSAWLTARPPRGACVVLSDFLFDGDATGGLGGGLNRGMARLRACGHELHCIQVLSPQELDPQGHGFGSGNLRLVDIESGSSRDMNITPQAVETYLANLGAHCQAVASAARRNGGSYLLTSTTAAVEQLILESLRRQNLLG